MNLVALPAFADNYFWMLHGGRPTFVIDPGDKASALDKQSRPGLALKGILVTPYRRDHISRPAGSGHRSNDMAHRHAPWSVTSPVTSNKAGFRKLRNLPTAP
jgi:hydroxyacylglutathione hydrolase